MSNDDFVFDRFDAQQEQQRKKNLVTTITKTALTRAQEMGLRFVDLLVASFAVAAGLAWKDSVFWMFSTKGPLGFLKYNQISLAIAITIVGAVLTSLRTYLPTIVSTKPSFTEKVSSSR